MRASSRMEEYFGSLKNELGRAMELADRARSQGADPKPQGEIPVANDLAERVEKLIGVDGVASRLRELEKSKSREEAALEIGLEIALGKVGGFDSRLDCIDYAVRTAVAVLTEGVVAAPIEGIAKIDLAKNDDGSEYIRVFYAGPIRSAGGTAQALSVLAADYVRRNLKIGRYVPRPDEVNRYVEEIQLYRRVANLQYTPSEEEIRLIVQNCPVCIDGEATEDAEVEGYRDLPRIETNRVRGGMALVIAEGIASKAPKVKKHVANLKLDGWDWLERFVVSVRTDQGKEEKQVKPKDKYLQDLIAGRPVFSYPSRKGGFRLRYGRSRNTGFAAAGISPVSMYIMDEFIAPGTQLKLERPGKAAGISPVDSIEGPTVKLYNGDVVRVTSVEQAKALAGKVAEILDDGELLVNFGDFIENNHPLVPASYCFEWWVQELPENVSGKEELREISGQQALELCDKYNAPLHPLFTYLWHDISIQDFVLLSEYARTKGVYRDNVLVLPLADDIKKILEALLVPHTVREGNVLIQDSLPLMRCLGYGKAQGIGECRDVYEAISRLGGGLQVRKRAPVRIGARMGRPEKSDKREMKPAPNVLFPLGEAGGRKRSLQDAKDYAEGANQKAGKIRVQVGMRICPVCQNETWRNRCECGSFTNPRMQCPSCKVFMNKPVCPKCGKETTSVSELELDFRAEYLRALERVGERDNFEKFKGVIGLTSKHKTPEPLEKGVLRAKHDVVTFKDGTARYDLSDLPLTHIRPDEIGTGVEKMRELGYGNDIYGKPLERGDQVVELFVQDIVVSKDCGEYLLRVARFVDDVLVKYYRVEPYYNVEKAGDLVGKLVIGLAPHTSAGVLGRIIGYTSASVGYAHPFFHAAKRRNCDGDEDCVMMLMDGLLNFSRSYLPDKRGGRMDAPLVLTVRIDPHEIDKEAHNIDVSGRYPLDFYRATQEFTHPKDIAAKMDLVASRLGSPAQYENFLFTNDTKDIAAGPRNSAYKTLGTMVEKMEAQFSLARRIRAVDAKDVAERVINSHFLPDLIGNLHSFAKQQVRCTKCNAKYRRPPLKGTCRKCGGNLVLTVHEGSVRKYLDVAIKVADEYDVAKYTKQRLELLELEMRSLFESDKVKQKGLADFM